MGCCASGSASGTTSKQDGPAALPPLFVEEAVASSPRDPAAAALEGGAGGGATSSIYDLREDEQLSLAIQMSLIDSRSDDRDEIGRPLAGRPYLCPLAAHNGEATQGRGASSVSQIQLAVSRAGADSPEWAGTAAEDAGAGPTRPSERPSTGARGRSLNRSPSSLGLPDQAAGAGDEGAGGGSGGGAGPPGSAPPSPAPEVTARSFGDAVCNDADAGCGGGLARGHSGGGNGTASTGSPSRARGPLPPSSPPPKPVGPPAAPAPPLPKKLTDEVAKALSLAAAKQFAEAEQCLQRMQRQYPEFEDCPEMSAAKQAVAMCRSFHQQAG
eukprot:TRINITY_DN47007_c0_g1_i1.p2 TRINITY_DN47007_c0_g1~~TRINITY_DN47007_c0_g1_i1.p2  ORF type:complete len:327 (-),score=64.71 TRINITY_DN47007_c0_g1_i1:188-1168(-)